jgi:hypothetical protein
MTIPVLAVFGVFVSGWIAGGHSAMQQRPTCLHGVGEAPTDAARRVDAIRAVRAVNTAQAQAFGQGRRYLSYKELTDRGLPRRPDGFSTQVTVEGPTYAVVLSDTSDPCGWTIFAVQEGVIYTGTPIQ